MTKYTYTKPKAITMWDFSWLERRWPGAGYEDWNRVLDELVVRGYDAVRIDAYPHLLAADPCGEWTLKPQWNQQAWGAPALTRVSRVRERLLEFITLCRDRGIAVALSSWFREDTGNIRMSVTAPEELARIWLVTLDAVAGAGLLESILYVDFCNEYPMDMWAPFLKNDAQYRSLVSAGVYPEEQEILRASEIGARWINRTVDLVKEVYPGLDYTFSQCSEADTLELQDVSRLDLLDFHLCVNNTSDFYERVGYHYERFDSAGYDNMALYGEALYRGSASYWDGRLLAGVARLADWSRRAGKPLVTTEGWAVIDYKDWPLLEWDWIKHLCEIAVKKAVSEGRWVAVCTSNFCGPQFVGMWRDIAWHQRLTGLIKGGALPRD